MIEISPLVICVILKDVRINFTKSSTDYILLYIIFSYYYILYIFHNIVIKSCCTTIRKIFVVFLKLSSQIEKGCSFETLSIN